MSWPCYGVRVRSVINCVPIQILICPVPSKFRHPGLWTLCHSGLLAGGDNLDIKGIEYLDILPAERLQSPSGCWTLDTKLGMRPGGINHWIPRVESGLKFPLHNAAQISPVCVLCRPRYYPWLVRTQCLLRMTRDHQHQDWLLVVPCQCHSWSSPC